MKAYAKGRRKEYKIIHELKDKGFDIVQRTAGSHSPIDILAINKTKQEIWLIQSKPEDYSEIQINKIKKELDFLNRLWLVKFFVI